MKQQLTRWAIALGWFSLRVLKGVVKVAHEQLEQIEPGVPAPNYLALPPAAVTVEAAVQAPEREVSQRAIAQQEGAIAQPTPKLQGVPSRGQVVETLLDEAWKQGKTTYPALIGYIEEKTGKACSRRTVSNWKKLRGLIEAA